METINSITSAATKVIWGDNTAENQEPGTDSTTTSTSNTTNTTNNMNTATQGQEPISGVQGDTSKGEPFDAGNIETGTTAGSKGLTTEHPSTTGVTGGTEGISSDRPSTTGVTAGSEGVSTGVPSTTGATTESKGPVTESSSTTGATAGSKGPTTEHPSTTGDTGGFKAAQADIRDPDSSATTDPKTEAARKNVDDKDGLDTSENPAKVEGAGPRPVEEVARERGGDAGQVEGAGGASNTKTKEGELDNAENKDSKGTGEEYVKTSGLKADGGDFDATKPGAGREADRLLEEKGMTTQTAAAAGVKKDKEEDVAESPDSKDKKSLKDKIKAKLHKDKS